MTITSGPESSLDVSTDPNVTEKPQPEFTLRAIIPGLLIGCLLCFTNLYFGLQTGWISMMSLQSALLGYLLSLAPGFPKLPKFTAQENVILQTVAVATGTMPLAAGFVGIIPALGLLNVEEDGQGPLILGFWQGIGWASAVAFFGVFLAAPLRKQVIIKENLPFPSGTATAQLISVMHNETPPSLRHRHPRSQPQSGEYTALSADDPERLPPSTQPSAEEAEEADALLSRSELKRSASEGWRALAWSFLASAVLTLGAYFLPVLFFIPVFDIFYSGLASDWLWWFSPSLSYVGIIMGFPITLSMNLGMLTGWAILSPLAHYQGWAPGPVGDMQTGSRGWILWVSLSIMCAESVVSLLPVVWEAILLLLPHRQKPAEDEDEERLVPTKWWAWGLGLTALLGVGGVWAVFRDEGGKIWAVAVGFLMGGVLSVLGVRALGETDLNPVSGLGKISQLLFAVLQPGNVVANIIAGGVAEAGAQQAGDLMQDLKTGHLLHTAPRAQLYSQLLGSLLSIFVTVGAYDLYKRAYPIPGPSFPAPTAYVWLSLARLLRDGSLPPKSGVFMLASAGLAIAVASVKVYAQRRGYSWAKWVPSGVAFAIGFLNTPSFSIARLIGGIIEYMYYRRVGKGHEGIWLIIVASGFVLGEGTMSVLTLVFKTLGIGAVTCWGCQGGICPSC
ncbi:oligopeptide transporter [Dacryopinax primogenitus]|uniref:Oligopeptide transporter n=1 Tax=Dacryopinax primogenitus (strain DJM 731) TaxID=1858805 RepID=M5GFZ6_DACPD|nr:oligopeptide transporter [Dacryopinax primogenitus]EJU04603.1 oligopeptide transporter [Dacryopinax primogenitus]